MKFINYKIGATRDEVMSVLKDSNRVVAEENFQSPKGKPNITVKERGNSIKMRCQMIDGPSKDYGFLEGTYFKGTVKEKDGVTTVRGIIVTAPIYHLIILALIVLLVIQCFRLGGINLVPILLTIFSLIMFKDEFKKQGIIKRYIFRALKITYAQKNPRRRSNQ